MLLPERCAKLDATKTADIDIRARASATRSAEACTELSCLFFIVAFPEVLGLPVRVLLYSPETPRRSSLKTGKRKNIPCDAAC
jgi:hypothetical protein